MQRKVGIYLRAATKDQCSGPFSKQIEGQKMQCRGKLEEMNRAIPDWGTLHQIYVDDGVSGLRLERPGISRLLEDVRNGMVNVVLVTDSSRLTRSCLAHWVLHNEFSKHGVQVVEVNSSESQGTCLSDVVVRFEKKSAPNSKKIIRRAA